MSKEAWNALIWITIIVCITAVVVIEKSHSADYRLATMQCEAGDK